MSTSDHEPLSSQPPEPRKGCASTLTSHWQSEERGEEEETSEVKEEIPQPLRRLSRGAGAAVAVARRAKRVVVLRSILAVVLGVIWWFVCGV